MEKSNKKPELDKFTVLNPAFYGITESHFFDKENNGDDAEMDTEKS